MCTVRPVEVIEVLPNGQLLIEIDIVSVSQQLVKLVLIGPMRSLNFTIQLWRAGLDVNVTKTFVFDMPVE